MGFGRHLLVLGALAVNLWIGGDLVEAWVGQYARVGFELALIFGYLLLVLRIPFGLGRRRPQDPPER
jgi:hypothetical protein